MSDTLLLNEPRIPDPESPTGIISLKPAVLVADSSDHEAVSETLNTTTSCSTPSPTVENPVNESPLKRVPTVESSEDIRPDASKSLTNATEPGGLSPEDAEERGRPRSRSKPPSSKDTDGPSDSESVYPTASRIPSLEPGPPVSRIPSPIRNTDELQHPNTTLESSPADPRDLPGPPKINLNDENLHASKRAAKTIPFPHIPSEARKEWERLKAQGTENEFIDELMKMVGLEDVKHQVLAILSKVETCKLQKVDLSNERFNIVFQGNPGTGKTTVARLYAKFLHSVGVLESSTMQETSGAKLASFSMGKRKVKKIIKKIVGTSKDPRPGGVLFVDEAYQLTASHSSNEGRQALDHILTEMENQIGRLVVIFVGYNEEMESFFEHNPGLSSRIPYNLQFNDFTDAELWQVLHDNIRKNYSNKMMVVEGLDGLYMRVAIRRLSRSRGIRGFGNARAVNNLLAQIAQRQAHRLRREAKEQGCTLKDLNYQLFTKEDIIGPDPSQAIKKSSAWATLHNLIGLDEVKKAAKVMESFIEANYKRELLEQRPIEFSLNRVFYGSPGTGKTTVGKLYGQIMADLGLLSKGEVVVKSPADFIGECLGKSEKKTRAILSTTIGKVLIIDEAYMLDSGGTGKQTDSYRAAVIDTLVAEVQSVPGDDRCIILLGYEDKLKEMFRNVNPGLSRRFAIDNPFVFEDFTLPQLQKILTLKLDQHGVTATPEGLEVAHSILERTIMRPNYSNASEVDSCLTTAKMNYEARQQKIAQKGEKREFSFILEARDFDLKYDRNKNAAKECKDRLKNMVSEDIIKKLVHYQHRAHIARKRGVNPRGEVPTNFVFKGPPGTGKTTTARSMGKLYYDMGLLSTDEVIECTTANLIGQYVGQTSPKTKAQLEQGLGKVLFIDEAYRLADRDAQFASEAVNELISLLSSPKFEGKMIVILAGYTPDMNTLMTTRPGLSSLFPEEVVFENLQPDECLKLLHRELTKRKINAKFLQKPESKDYMKLRRIIRALQVYPSWSNARQIRILAKDMSSAAFEEEFPYTLSTESTISPELSPELVIPLTTQSATKCVKKMWQVEHDRWSTKDKKNGSYTAPDPVYLDSTPSSNVAPGMAPAQTTPTTAVDQSFSMPSHSSGSKCPGYKPEKQLGNQPTGAESAKEATTHPHDHDKNQCEGEMEQHQVHRHCIIRQPGTNGDNDEMLELTPEQRRAYESKMTAAKKKALEKRLVALGACFGGCGWVRVAGGYKCSAMYCFLSDAEIGDV